MTEQDKNETDTAKSGMDIDVTEVKERIMTVLERESPVILADIPAGTTLADSGVDSITVVEMLMGLEEEFDVYIPVDGPLSEVKTVDELLDVLAKMVQEQMSQKND